MPVMEGKAIFYQQFAGISAMPILIEALPQPVMHDDVHGTVVIALAAATVGCREAGIELRAAVVDQLGLGTAMIELIQWWLGRSLRH